MQNISLLMISKDCHTITKMHAYFLQKKKIEMHESLKRVYIKEGHWNESHFTQSSNSHQLE